MAIGSCEMEYWGILSTYMKTDYNVWTRRSQGRAPRGEPARHIVHHQRGKNLNIIFAVSDEVALVYYRISTQTDVTRDTFEDFLAATVEECRRVYPEVSHIYFIYDNARPHIRAHLPPDAQHFSIKFLPPYSPFLNPTEMAHSAFKAGVKRNACASRVAASYWGSSRCSTSWR